MAADLSSAMFLHMADVVRSVKYTLSFAEIYTAQHIMRVSELSCQEIVFDVHKPMCVFQLNMSV